MAAKKDNKKQKPGKTEHKPEWISRNKFIELAGGGLSRQAVAQLISRKTIEENDSKQIDKNHPKTQKYLTKRAKLIDQDRIANLKLQQDELSEIKLRKEREELRIKELNRKQLEGELYPVKRFLHLKDLYFTNAPKRVHQEHRNWLRVVAKKYNIPEKDRLELDSEFGELINKTYEDELHALEANMKIYDQ